MTSDPAANFSALDGYVVLLAVISAVVLLQRRVREARFWYATVTPLASIIGSGFLVVVPLLAGIAGAASAVAMIGIVLLSFWLGNAIRFTILHEQTDVLSLRLGRMSDTALAFAYAISIAFYIRLMCGFVLTGFGMFTEFNADLLATIVMAFIGISGFLRGLHGLERLEEYSVTVKLAIIVALLAALAYHDVSSGYDVTDLPSPVTNQWERLCQLGGMLLIVQGFETSKYLSTAYDASLRARSMRFAQILAGGIYITFVVLAMPLMAPFARTAPSETAIIQLSAEVSLVLPVMLVIAAAMSQFSAAIADTIGAGGVVESETRQRVSARASYPVIACLAVALIWGSNIFQAVALASRAFALFYMFQAVLAARLAMNTASGRRRWALTCSYSSLAMIMLGVVLFARPAEG